MEYNIPKAPKIKPKVMQPDQRKFCVVPLRAVVDNNMTRTQLRILCLLASYCNKSGFTYVSQLKMANDIGVTPQAISKHLKKLEEQGYIKSYSGYSTGIKGKTKRIIYDENITDREAEQIGGEPKEPFSNREYNELLKMKRNNKIQSETQHLEVEQSELQDIDRLTRLKSVVAEVDKLAEIAHLERIGMPIKKILARFKY